MIRLRISSRRLTSTAVVLLAGLSTATASSPAGDLPTRKVTLDTLVQNGQASRVVTNRPPAMPRAPLRPFTALAQQSDDVATSQDELAFRRLRHRRSHSADVVRTWHALAVLQPTNPIRQSRALAIMHAAMHDAVNGAVPTYESYASWLSDPSADPEAAAAAAAHRVLINLFPAASATFDAQLASSLAHHS